jgi:hypothetical protein
MTISGVETEGWLVVVWGWRLGAGTNLIGIRALIGMMKMF